MQRRAVLLALMLVFGLVSAEGMWMGNMPSATGTRPDLPKLEKPRNEQLPRLLQGRTEAQDRYVPPGLSVDIRPRQLEPMVIEPSDNPDETLYYDQRLYAGLGLNSGGTFWTGARFTPTVGCTLKSILFYQFQEAQNGYVYVFDQGGDNYPGAVLESVPYNGADTGWKNIVLTTTLQLPAGRDFWIGVRTTHDPYVYPMGCDYMPPGVPLRSFFYTVNRVTWYDLSNYFGAWNLRAVIAPLPYDNDMGAISFDGVKAYQRPNQWITIKTTVKNLGMNTQNAGVPVKLRIEGPGGYVYTDNDQVTQTNLGRNQTEQITFMPQWRTPNTLGTYTLKAWTELSTDEDRSNDTVRMTIEVTNWLFYADFNSPYWYTWATPEKGVFIVPNEFGVSYPIQVESLKAVFYRGSHVWRDSTFRFKIYGEDFRTLLYASPWIEAVPPPGGGMVEVKHYLSTPVQITDGNFLITVDCYGDSGYPDLLADGVPQYRSVFGDSLQWYYWDYGELMIASFVNWGASPHDVGFSNIHAPLMYTEPGQNMTPIGVVTNYGTENETAVRCSCFVVDTLTDARVYSGYASIPSLPAGETAVVQFPQWAVPAGNNVYQVQMATFLPDDGNPYNDAIYHVFFGFHIVDQLYSPRVSPTVTVDGYLDPNEWAEANRYDISNIMGFADPYYRYFPNNAWLYVMHDENRLYLGGDLTFVTYSDSTEFGLYFDENNDGAWAGDSSEGNYWALHRPRTTPVDSIIYRSLPSGWRTTPPGCVSRTSYASGHEQFEVALPFGTAKHQLNCNPDGDTVGFYAFLMSEIYNMWPGWWHTLMDENYWNQPAYYHKLVLGPKLRFDVAAKQVLVPTGTLDTGTTFTPTAKWRNEHTTPADFSAFFTITDPAGTQVYLQSQSLTAVPGQTDTTLRFLNFTVRDTGIWSVRCSTWCQGDTNPANDVITSTFRVRLPVLAGGWFEMAPAPPGAKAFKDGGWLAIEDGIIYAAKGNKSGEFYSFDPLAGSNGVWTTLASIPNGTEAKPPYKGAVGVAAGKYIYATKGNNTLGFWRYNIDSAAWQQMPDVPLGASGKRVKGGTDMVYVQGTGHDTGYVYLLKGINQEFFRFNTATGTWDTSLPPAPAGAKPKWDKGSWLALQRNPGHSIYRIYAHKAKYHELWVFDHVTRTWSASPLPGMPLVGMMGKSKKSKDGGCGAWYDNGIYALKGGNTQEFWYFDVPTSSWQELDTMPSVGSTAKKKRVKAGADIVAYGDGTFYALKGNKTLELWRYRLAAALAGQTLPERSGVMAEPARLTRPEFNVMSPARGRTVISYVLPQASAASVTVFDVAGRTVVRQVLTGRSGRVTLELGSLSAGVYLVRCDGAGFTATRKLVVE